VPGLVPLWLSVTTGGRREIRLGSADADADGRRFVATAPETAKVPLALSDYKRLALAEMIGPYLAGEVNG
jgi:hypothetical protein